MFQSVLIYNDCETKLDLHDCLPSTSDFDFANCKTVVEDGWYKINFCCDCCKAESLKAINVYLNGSKIGYVNFEIQKDSISGNVMFKESDNKKEVEGKQAFLLLYDLVVLSFEIVYADETTEKLFSDYLLCVSRDQNDADNINSMLKELNDFDNTQISEWLFSNTEKEKSGLNEGQWSNCAYRSLSSYIQLLEEIVTCYRCNYAYFKTLGKHTIKKSSILLPHSSVKSVTISNFNWLMQNTSQLSQVPHSSGIQYRGKNYLPLKMKSDVSEKSYDVYENRIVVNFLYTVLTNANSIYKEFDRDIINEERILSKIQSNVPRDYVAPIITIKSLQISFSKTMLKQLQCAVETLQNIYKQYISLFDLPVLAIKSLPRKTKTFQEIKPYMQVFQSLVRWFRYGEFSLAKDRLLLQVKTLDKLFEYYCLYKLLIMLANQGYKKADKDSPIFKHKYESGDEYYHNERDVANTYILSKGDASEVTLYYQPVISEVCFENNISLYRTTHSKDHPYFSPDFVLKFNNLSDELYVIFDSKFSSRRNIKKRYLPDIIAKYYRDVAVANPISIPKMVWALQGRVDANENKLYFHHKSVLAKQYAPATSFGIVPINTRIDMTLRLWNEIKKCIPWLQ